MDGWQSTVMHACNVCGRHFLFSVVWYTFYSATFASFLAYTVITVINATVNDFNNSPFFHAKKHQHCTYFSDHEKEDNLETGYCYLSGCSIDQEVGYSRKIYCSEAGVTEEEAGHLERSFSS